MPDVCTDNNSLLSTSGACMPSGHYIRVHVATGISHVQVTYDHSMESLRRRIRKLNEK